MRRARGFKLHSMLCWVFSSLLDWFTTTFHEKSTSPFLGLQILFSLTVRKAWHHKVQTNFVIFVISRCDNHDGQCGDFQATSSVTASFQFHGAERGHHSLSESGSLRSLKHTDVTIVLDNEVLYAMISRPTDLSAANDCDVQRCFAR